MFFDTFSRPLRRLGIRPVCAAIAILSFGIAGCGGSQNKTEALVATRATGTATFSVKWPERTTDTRLVPNLSNSIRVTLTNPGTGEVLATRLIVRPTGGEASTVTESIGGLPVGTLRATATAFPNMDGSGVAQASATSTVTVRVGANSPLSLTMGSTIRTIEIAPNMLQLETAVQLPLIITAKDSAGNVVLTDVTNLTFAVTDTTIASVDGAGNVIGIKEGASTLTATETESGVTASIPITVTLSRVDIVNLATNDIAYDPYAQRIYASIPSTFGPINGNSIISLNPGTQELGQPIFVGSEPGVISITTGSASADGNNAAYLYCGLTGQSAVVRVNLQTGILDAKFNPGDGGNVFNFADDIQTLPGNPDSVIVSQFIPSDTPPYKGTFVYDVSADPDPANAFLRSATRRPTTGSVSTDTLVLDDVNNIVYGFDTQNAPTFQWAPLAISNAGITTTPFSVPGVKSVNADVVFAGGRGFTSDGLVIQGQTTPGFQSIGTIASLAIGDATAPVAADATFARVWYLTGGSTGTVVIKAFDSNAFLPVGQFTINDVQGLPSDLIRWGDTGLAFRTSAGQVYLIRRAPGLPNAGSPAGL